MIRRPPRSTLSSSSAASDVYKRQFLNRTKYGLWIRAVKQDPQIATAMGIPVSIVYMSTVALGGILAGLSGVLAGPIVAIEYQMGLKILAYSFIIVVVGGFGSIM